MAVRAPIYTPEDKAKVVEAKNRLAQLIPILDDASDCGVACEQFRQLSDTMLERLTSIESRFMTHL